MTRGIIIIINLNLLTSFQVMARSLHWEDIPAAALIDLSQVLVELETFFGRVRHESLLPLCELSRGGVNILPDELDSI